MKLMTGKKLIRPRKERAVRLLGILSIVISGCSDNSLTDLEQYVRQMKSRPAKPISPLPEIEPYKTFAYQAADLRNPFTPAVVELPVGSAHPDQNRDREALEKYPLDSLIMVGTIRQGESIWALIHTPDGVLYRVKKGNYLGQNYGKIIHISEEKIEITEIVPSGEGGWLERQTMLALAGQSQEEGQ